MLLVAIGMLPAPAKAEPRIRETPPTRAQPQMDLSFKRVQPPGKYAQVDISQYDPKHLAQRAKQAYERGDYQQAVQYHYWAVQNGVAAHYDLACDYALLGEVEEAMHWLKADAEAGNTIDVAFVDNDKDLNQVRKHPGWPQLRQYLSAMEGYWAKSGITAYQAILPTGYDGSTAIPVLVGLHGRGDTPKDFIHADYQTLADQLNIAFVAISGVVPTGKNSFAWATDPKTNVAHVNKVLTQLFRAEKIKPGKMALFGFSQGAQVSLQLAVAESDKWSGAIAMSPGLFPAVSLVPVSGKQPSLSHQRYLITNGEKEYPANLNLAKADLDELKQMGASPKQLLYPDMGHSFPPDYYKQFPRWAANALQLNGKPEQSAAR